MSRNLFISVFLLFSFTVVIARLGVQHQQTSTLSKLQSMVFSINKRKIISRLRSIVQIVEMVIPVVMAKCVVIALVLHVAHPMEYVATIPVVKAVNLAVPILMKVAFVALKKLLSVVLQYVQFLFLF